MRFLYGDSTESPLEIDYIDFLRGALDFAVDALLAGQRIGALHDKRQELSRRADAEVDKLDALVAHVERSLESVRVDDGSDVSACASAIVESAAKTSRGHATAVKARLRDELSKVDGEIRQQRGLAASALERLLIGRPIPGARPNVHVRLEPSERYSAQVTETSTLGLTWTTELEIPPDHPFAAALRVDRLAERLAPGRMEIRVPEQGGLLRKRVRSVSHRLGKEQVLEVSRREGGTSFKLREGVGEVQPGYDVEIQNVQPRVRVARVSRGGAADEPFEPEPEDAERLLELGSTLADAASELTRHRQAVVDLRFEGDPFELQGDPSELAHRLLELMAPVVAEMARRSPSGEELVLKRLLANDRREEVFVPMDELRRKLDRLPPTLRRAFATFPFFHEGDGPDGSNGAGDAGDDDVTVDRGAPAARAEAGEIAGDAEPARKSRAIGAHIVPRAR